MSILMGLAALFIGLFAGFLINVIATRLAGNKPLFGRLRCTQGAHALSIAQALPVVGYVLQRGRCSTCAGKLPVSFPLIEILAAALFVALYAIDGISLRFVLHGWYAAVLLLVLVVDWKHRDIYVSVIVAGSVVALLGSILLPDVGLASALIGAGVAGGFFLLAFLLAKLIFPRIEEPLGAGDVLLALMMGLMLGFPNVVGALLIGPLIAGATALVLLVSRRSKLGDFMPYGVALCVASILFLVYPAPLAQALNLPALRIVLSNLLNNL